MKEWKTGGIGANTANPMPLVNIGYLRAKGTDAGADFSYGMGAILMRDTDGYLIPHDGSKKIAYVLKGGVYGKAGKKVTVGVVLVGMVNLTASGVISEGDYVDVTVASAEDGVVEVAAPLDVTELYKLRGKALQDAADGERVAVWWGVL